MRPKFARAGLGRMALRRATAITSVAFGNFKGLRSYSLALEPFNVLVGPNNAGKSTIIGAFRVLSAALRRARAKRPERLQSFRGLNLGYRISADSVPVSLENAHTDYLEGDATITFKLSNGNRLVLRIAGSNDLSLYLDAEGRILRTTGDFEDEFPIRLGVVPVLGPLDHEEALVDRDTVRRNLETHIASRNFRSFWWHTDDGFSEFAELVKLTWPGMEVERPEVDWGTRVVRMFCKERRLTRELYWVGHGFQIWCQILTHLVRSRDASLVVIDEPEIYLHPDLQRQLVYYLRDLGPAVVIATHSSEIVAEAEPGEIVMVEKARRSGQRLRDASTVQAALDSIGSLHNVALTQLARTRRLLFVENYEDFKVLRRFAARIGLKDLAAGQGITVVPCEGFGSWQRVKSFGWGMRKTVGTAVSVGVVLDRDYYCGDEIDEVRQQLEQDCLLVHILARKELENYLLVPAVLGRAICWLLGEKGRRGRPAEVVAGSIRGILDEVSGATKSEVEAQLIGKRMDFLSRRGHGGDRATVTKGVIVDVEARWADLGQRLQIGPGKEILAGVRAEVQRHFGVTLTLAVILRHFSEIDLAEDLIPLLRALEKFRAHRPVTA